MQNFLAGYQALIDQFHLKPLPHYRSSMIKMHGKPVSTVFDHHETHEYSKNYALQNPNDPFEQLEFALKYDGINLEILTLFFKRIKKQDICQWIKQRPTGKYTRIAWYLFEMLTDEKLSIPDCKKIKYINLLDPDKYFTAKLIKSSRHGIYNNLLGNKFFCPIVRRTATLNKYVSKRLDLKAQKIVQKYEPSILVRANNYLLTKETMSSYEIEHEKPNKERITKFVNLLQKIEAIELLTKEILIECQNTIVDYRFVDHDYRHNQNYVGENINQYLQKIHFIAPKPQDLSNLMNGLFESLEIMTTSNCHPVIIAAAISFGFVILHPFEDGNGRLHRFLIHYILNRQKFTPPGITFPISAIILQNIRSYDAILESFSKPLMSQISNYHLDNNGILTVNEETGHFYQYIDFTNFAEYLFFCIEETINVHFTKELEFLVNYDKTKRAIQMIVDMPDRLIDLFIRILIQNNGKLGQNKRKKLFGMLTKDELIELTKIVSDNMLNKNNKKL